MFHMSFRVCENSKFTGWNDIESVAFEVTYKIQKCTVQEVHLVLVEVNRTMIIIKNGT